MKNILAALLSLISFSFVQAQQYAKEVDTYLTAIRQDQRPANPQALWQNPEQHPEVLTAPAFLLR